MMTRLSARGLQDTHVKKKPSEKQDLNVKQTRQRTAVSERLQKTHQTTQNGMANNVR